MLVTGVIVVGLQREIVVDGEAIVILIYYMLIHSLYLLATTLAINILSIQLSGIIAFGIVESINFVGIATYTLLGVLITNEAEIARRYAWVLKINPFAHLVFSVHSSCINEINTIVNCKGIDFDLNISVIFFLVMVFVVLESGCIIVNHCEFLTNSKEGM